MIRLNLLNNQIIALNPDLIETMEETPDLVIKLISGRKFVVNQTMDQVIDRIINYKSRVMGNCISKGQLLAGLEQ
ncbi:MAG: flagellar FlbD family protein [Vulcanimicrobiota bacterium]